MNPLRGLLLSAEILIAPGVYDALTAVIAERAGFRSLYLSGAGVAYSRLGRPDIGLTTMSEMVDTLALIRDRVALPIIIDGDTGFGNALNAQRTMRMYERAGAAAVQIEDQQYPKRCGHLTGKSLIPASEMAGKIAAMAEARTADTLIIARTDAVAVEGFDAAIARAEHYLQSGADVLFVEAPRSVEELGRVAHHFRKRVPLLANMVEGGMTPCLKADELQQLGYAMVIFPGGIVRATARAAEAYFSNLLLTGSNAGHFEQMYDFDRLNRVLGTEDILARGKRFDGSCTGAGS